MRAALKQFPSNSMIFTMLVAVAQRSTGERQKELATEIIGAPGAPAERAKDLSESSPERDEAVSGGTAPGYSFHRAGWARGGSGEAEG